MVYFRNPKYVERYEDVYYELDTALALPGNNAHQKKVGHRFMFDSTGESNPFDWYHARLNIDFKLQLLANGGNVGDAVQTGMVNSAYSLIKKLNVKMKGVDVYDCDNANHAINIKNLLEYSQGYSKSQGPNEFFYIDNNRGNGLNEFAYAIVKAHADNEGNAEDDPTNVVKGRFVPLAANPENAYNKGFITRKTLLLDNRTVNVELPLNRYSFFASFHDKILPNNQIILTLDIENDNNLVWRTGGADGRIVLTKLQLIVPRVILNPLGSELYLKEYDKPIKWTYLRDIVYEENATQQASGSFRMTTAVNRPKHVFVFILNNTDLENQTQNNFLYNTFNIGTNHVSILRCYIEVGNGREYPEVNYRPSTEPSRLFRDVLKYVHANSEYAIDTLLNRTNFGSIFSFVYFDLTKQPMDIKDGMTKLIFHYTLTGAPGAAYKIYALVLYEQDVEIRNIDNKVILRSE